MGQGLLAPTHRADDGQLGLSLQKVSPNAQESLVIV
jgi:hypothetical protein